MERRWSCTEPTALRNWIVTRQSLKRESRSNYGTHLRHHATFFFPILSSLRGASRWDRTAKNGSKWLGNLITSPAEEIFGFFTCDDECVGGGLFKVGLVEIITLCGKCTVYLAHTENLTNPSTQSQSLSIFVFWRYLKNN